MMLAGIAIDQVVEISEARPKLEKSILDAKADPDLARMVKLKEGVGQIEAYWSSATVGGPSPSSAFMADFAPVAVVATIPLFLQPGRG
jgi:hypothetical protein